MYLFLADAIVVIHFAYIFFVIVGLLLILLGALLGWQWVRNPWFRVIHLVMIVVVAVESIFNFECPLTTWDQDLRVLAGQSRQEGTFIGRMLGGIIYVDAPVDHPAFKVAYITFAVLVIATFWFAPVRWRRQTDPVTSPS